VKIIKNWFVSYFLPAKSFGIQESRVVGLKAGRDEIYPSVVKGNFPCDASSMLTVFIHRRKKCLTVMIRCLRYCGHDFRYTLIINSVSEFFLFVPTIIFYFRVLPNGISDLKIVQLLCTSKKIF